MLRRVLLGWAAGFVAVLSGAPTAPVQAEQSAHLTAPPMLDRSGRWLVDEQGRVVILHGTNMVNKLAPYYPAALGFGDDDLQFLADHGVNTIRLGWNWQGLEPTMGVYDEAYLDQMVAVVQQVESYGMVPVLEFHQDFVHAKFGIGQGFPDWAVASNPTGLVGLGAFMQGFMDNRPLAGVGLQDRLAVAWQHIAARLAGDRIVMFELFNEPVPAAPVDLAQCLVPLGCPLSDRTRLAPMYSLLLDAIRRVDRDRLVYIEPWVVFDFGFKTWLPPTSDPNVAFAFHVYCLTGAASPLPVPPVLSGVGCPELFALGMANATEYEHRTGQPMLLTEFGAGGPEDAHVAVADLADQAMIGWQHWAYFAQDAGEPRDYGLLRDISKGPVSGNVREDQLRALTRPYPQAVAGTPHGFGYDSDTRVFHLDYTTSRVDGSGRFDAGARTVMYVPPLAYPDGYAAQVTGARIESEPGADHLVVVACADASAVHVTVTAGGTSNDDCPLTVASSVASDGAEVPLTRAPRPTLPRTGGYGLAAWTGAALLVAALTIRRLSSS